MPWATIKTPDRTPDNNSYSVWHGKAVQPTREPEAHGGINISWNANVSWHRAHAMLGMAQIGLAGQGC
jgi:hypothetical protein